MKSHARVIVIGGGAVGCSALYHLTRLGWTDVVLLERDELTAGSTWHAAGNCPNFSTSWNILKLQRHSTALYERLAQEVGIYAGIWCPGLIGCLLFVLFMGIALRTACSLFNSLVGGKDAAEGIQMPSLLGCMFLILVSYIVGGVISMAVI